MRYEIGKIYPFIIITGTEPGQTGVRGFLSNFPFLPWHHTLKTIDIRLMECIEHHKVPDHWDETNALTCDGFIFKQVSPESDKDSIWHNQYPRASYGQLDDSMDRIIDCPKKEEELMEYVQMEDALYRIGLIERGIKLLDQPVQKSSLEDLKQKIIKEIETQSGKKVEIKPYVIQGTILPNSFKVNLV